MIMVGVIDGHPISRWGMQWALKTAPDVRIVGTYAEPAAATGRYDVVLFDPRPTDGPPPAGGGYAVGFSVRPPRAGPPQLSAVAALSQNSALLVVSASKRQADIDSYLAAGARLYLHKGSEPGTFVQAIRAVSTGETP